MAKDGGRRASRHNSGWWSAGSDKPPPRSPMGGSTNDGCFSAIVAAAGTLGLIGYGLTEVIKSIT